MVGGLAGINLYVTWICGRRFFSHPIARWRSCRTLPSYYTMPLNRGIYYVMPFGPRTQPRLPHNEFLVCLSDCLFASLAPVCFFPTPHPPSLSVFFPQQSVFSTAVAKTVSASASGSGSPPLQVHTPPPTTTPTATPVLTGDGTTHVVFNCIII